MAVAADGAAPTLILDAGTGLRRLPELLGSAPLSGSILLGHLHWDHTQGLPFCSAVDDPAARVELHMPAQGDAQKVLAGAMGPPHFPIEPYQLRGQWSFDPLETGEHTVEGFTVLAEEIPHKGGRTFGYRVSDGTAAIAYLSDHQPTAKGPGEHGVGAYHPAALRLAEGVDLLIHDAQYTAEEFPTRRDWGHSTVEYPVRLAERAGAKAVLLYHHSPSRTDDELDRIVEDLRSWATVPVSAAVEGETISLPGQR